VRSNRYSALTWSVGPRVAGPDSQHVCHNFVSKETRTLSAMYEEAWVHSLPAFEAIPLACQTPRCSGNIARFGWYRGAPALNHEYSFHSLVVSAKNVHHFTVNRKIGYGVLALRMKITSRLDTNHIFVPPERGPLEQIDFPFHPAKNHASLCLPTDRRSPLRSA
jgi:hypothetical protein